MEGNVTWRPGHACIEQEVRTLRHGETVDLTALYETYSDLLFRTALTYVSHSEDAQDVVHDVFAVYLAKRPTFQDTSHQRAWMLRVTINKCRDLQRRNAVRRYTPLEDAEHIASPEDSETSELLAAVRSLPDKLHEVVVLHIGAEPVSIPADHPQMTSGLREVSGGIPLALEIGETTRVSVSGGEFSLFDPEGELLGDGTEAEISEDVLLYWDLSGTEDTMFSLTLKTNGKQLTYVLSMRDDGGYDLQQNQSPK